MKKNEPLLIQEKLCHYSKQIVTVFQMLAKLKSLYEKLLALP